MKKFLLRIHSNRINDERGQSLVEIALFLPIFILLIAGIVEMGYYLNRYLGILDSSREAARFGADLDPINNYNPQFNHNSPSYLSSATYDCTTTTEFYTAVACYAEENLPVPLNPSNGYDDIVITAFTIKNGMVCNNYRYPDYMDGTTDKGWSYKGNQVSQFSILKINGLFDDTSPQQGILLLEIFYRHRQILGLPFFTIFVPRDIGIYLYTIMPNPTAGTVDC